MNQFVIAGPNGSGKTTVLEAVLFALERDDLVLRDPRYQARWSSGFPPGAKVDVELSTDDGLDHRWRDTPSGFRSLARNPVQIEYFTSWRAPHLVGPLAPLGPGKRPADTEDNRLWRLKQRLIDEKSRQSFVSAPNRESEWLALLNRAWSMLHGPDGTSLEVQIIDEKAEDLFADVFVVKAGKRLCSIDHLSSGELELVSAAGWLVTSGMREGILLIDEPELHLHPQWQATFLPALREIAPGLQIIASTHADAPWRQAQPWERALLVDRNDPRSDEWRSAHASRPEQP